ncbi:unnamed protein product [Phytophthora lilii]|uniref:Unnamed protein product n=1 Tax=Phytophthora lilii TaxID=2077276 RepID=A0A9W6TGR5_9STRA|nr:unnamed protein product [Phytophthora lilii]
MDTRGAIFQLRSAAMPLDLQLRGDGAAALRMFLASHLAADQLNRQDVKKLLLDEAKDALATAELRLVASLLKQQRAADPTTPTLASLLRQGGGVRAQVAGATQEEDEQMKKKRAQYLAKRREKLQRLDEEMRYGSMVRNVKTQSAATELAHHQTSVRQHLSIGANMVMARVTAFIAVYFVARNLTENETTVGCRGVGVDARRADGLLLAETCRRARWCHCHDGHRDGVIYCKGRQDREHRKGPEEAQERLLGVCPRPRRCQVVGLCCFSSVLDSGRMLHVDFPVRRYYNSEGAFPVVPLHVKAHN